MTALVIQSSATAHSTVWQTPRTSSSSKAPVTALASHPNDGRWPANLATSYFAEPPVDHRW
jgi:hypothetical protein